jgi:hypothetical protein
VLEAADAPAGDLADLDGDLRRGRGRRVVLLRLETDHPRWLDRAVPGRERRSQCHRHLAEDVTGDPVPDHPRHAVKELDDLDVAFEHGVRARSSPSLTAHSPGRSTDVGGRAGKWSCPC